MSTELIVLGTFNETEIHARPQDRYVDVTEMCQAHAREWRAYSQLESAKRFKAALTESIRIPDPLLVITGDGRGNHTFADRRIALHCAAWISPEFEVWVYDRIEKLLFAPTQPEAMVPAKGKRRRGAKGADKGMMSVYPPWDVGIPLGGYRSKPFVLALRICADAIWDAAIEVEKRFLPEEWEAMLGVVLRHEWEPESPNPGALLAYHIQRAHGRNQVGFGKQADGPQRIQALADKLRACTYHEAFAIVIAATWRQGQEVEPGDPWWTIAYRAARMEEQPASDVAAPIDNVLPFDAEGEGG